MRLIFIFFLSSCNYFANCHTEQNKWAKYDLASKMVKSWSRQIGQKLNSLSEKMTRREKAEEIFQRNVKIETYNGSINVNRIASKLREFMDKKVDAVNKISKYAELLSYYRKNDPLFANSSYYYYNADNLTDTQDNYYNEQNLTSYITESECQWWCDQHNYKNYTIDAKLFKTQSNSHKNTDCECKNMVITERNSEFFLKLPLVYNERFQDFVNLNLSIAKIATNVYNREQDILEGVRWSEPLDLVFKENLKQDPTLTWQYFASPKGFMRHFPAVKWSDEQYDRTYDFRTRSWYTEAMTLPKDIIILLDRSGSMTGEKIDLSLHIVNDILDTLNDNDFVNIYTFTNSTEPLVSCFEDDLVQANEENLRLFRESLSIYNIEFAADIMIGIKKAYQILKKFRRGGNSANCSQAILLITEGLDYPYDTNVFKLNSIGTEGNPIRIFTYQIGADSNDAKQLEYIACENMGYYVNISVPSEIREKILNYLNVLSRPINFNYNHEQVAIWTYLHVDLADRRLSNWLWRKYEGIRQREVFLDHVKREYINKGKKLTAETHMLLQDTHSYEKYEKKFDYNYMTTVSLPVYGRRHNEVDLIGVAGVDVPIKLFHMLIPHHELGVNGYAFIVTNNGYVLMHPDHRREFENILKPTFNRVDLLEVEIMDDNGKPRMFDEAMVTLREHIVNRTRHLDRPYKVKFTLHNMKRIILSRKYYYYTELGPFTFGIVLPDKYGQYRATYEKAPRGSKNLDRELFRTPNWKVHPEWIYCSECKGSTPESKVRQLLWKYSIKDRTNSLAQMLIAEANLTGWFDHPIENEEILNDWYIVNKVFIATQSGLTRWRSYNHSDFFEEDKDSFEIRNNRAIDEDWYRRAVEENYKNDNIYIYSVPFQISGYENNTMITSTKAIFVEQGEKKVPVAVVGLQFNHRTMYKIYNNITTKCYDSNKKKSCQMTCDSDNLNCFILDNNAYIVLSDEIEYTGRYFGDIRPDIMYHLIMNEVYKATEMFDYQAICQKLPPEKKEKEKVKKSSGGISMFKFFWIENLSQLINWTIYTIFTIIKTVSAGPDYQSEKKDTIDFEKLEIPKTFPTPCDHRMWLFTLQNNFIKNTYKPSPSKFQCDWAYVAEIIPNTTLLFLAINGLCAINTQSTYTKSPTPTEIHYNDTLPCYIDTVNKFKRRNYMNCYKIDPLEYDLNKKDHWHCGHNWE